MGWEPGSNGGRNSMGGRRRGGRSWEKWEELHNIGTIFCSRKSTQRRELLQKGGGGQEVQITLPPPPPRRSHLQAAVSAPAVAASTQPKLFKG